MIPKECIVGHEGQTYVVCKKISEHLGLTRGQYHNQFKKIKKDPLLSKYLIQIPMNTQGGIQDMICINIKCLIIWLTKINFNTLTNKQYSDILDVINYTFSTDFDTYKYAHKSYQFESELRDEIFNCGYFKDIKIVDKEVMYSFGRIDLLGIDKNGNKICIELKKYKEFSDTKAQLLKYKGSNIFNKIYYCSYLIDDDFQLWCKKNAIETFIYKRELKIMEV